MAERRIRPKAPGTSAEDIEAMIRVDHAGEYGAVRIYEGQLAVLRARAPGSDAVRAIEAMAAGEQKHLQTFDKMIVERRVRPTALEPVWRMAGFALGAATAMMGERSAMTCTAAVEEVIDEHYGEQLDRLAEREPELAKTIAEFRADEAAHRHEALNHGGGDGPGQKLLGDAIKAGCRIAIRLSEKI